MVHRVGRVFRAILGGRTGQIVWCAVCGDSGDVSEQFDSGGFVDSGHFVGAVLGAGAFVECAVSAVLVSVGGLRGRIVLYVWIDAELLCD